MDLCRLLAFEVSAHTCVCGAMAFLQYDTGTGTSIPVLLQLKYKRNSLALHGRPVHAKDEGKTKGGI